MKISQKQAICILINTTDKLQKVELIWIGELYWRLLGMRMLAIPLSTQPQAATSLLLKGNFQCCLAYTANSNLDKPLILYRQYCMCICMYHMILHTG